MSAMAAGDIIKNSNLGLWQVDLLCGAIIDQSEASMERWDWLAQVLWRQIAENSLDVEPVVVGLATSERLQSRRLAAFSIGRLAAELPDPESCDPAVFDRVADTWAELLHDPSTEVRRQAGLALFGGIADHEVQPSLAMQVIAKATETR